MARRQVLALAPLHARAPSGPTPAARLVVEVDGGHHDDPSVAARDAARVALVRAAGVTVLRLPNEQILHDPERALDCIRQLLRAPRRRHDTR
ncbi:MAG: DUF559 domain-containing protein [Myxococcales bacterium]|nr:DUF559 domain-containing protein [Myxococcales bacterium]